MELAPATADGQSDLAGSYASLTLEAIGSDLNHFRGTPVASWFGDGDTVLLGCECGEWGCWPLTTSVDVGSSQVVWRGFRQGHRSWDLSALGPFTFDRSQYESALTSIPLR